MVDEDLKRLLDSLREENRAAHAETRQHAEGLAAETRQHTEGLVAETRQHAEGLAAETRQHAEALAADTRQHSETLTAETRLHFEAIVERLDHKIDGVAGAVVVVGEKASSRISSLEQRMDRAFADTQNLIRFSHAELDRRALE